MKRLHVFLASAVAILLAFSGCHEASGPTEPDAADLRASRGGSAVPGPSCDATVTGGSSIQDAVDAADAGDRICVEAGTYVEQVTVNEDLTLQGIDDPVIRAPADPAAFTIPESGPTWEPVVFAFGGSESGGDVSGAATVEVDVRGFVVDGDGRQPDARRAVGILYRNAGGTVADNTVRRMGVGGKETMGILAYGDSHVRIAENVVTGYERGGIGANGDGGAHPSPRVIIEGNEVVGSTGIGEAWAPNGIQVGFGATGRITGNVVRDNRWSETDPVASCILVFESDGVAVRGNEARNCDAGVGVGSWGWFLPSADNVKIQRNAVEEAIAGIRLEAVAWDGFSSSDPSVSNGKVGGNELTGGSPGVVGIAIAAVDADPTFDPLADNNKVIRNTIAGFATAIDDEGTDSKKRVNAITP